MLDSYLFVPGDKKKFLDKIKELSPDFFVIDLEDSVSKNKKKDALKNILNREFNSKTLFRIPYLDLDNSYTREELIELSIKCKGKIVLPKIRNVDNMDFIFSMLKNIEKLELIVLVENPECLLNLKNILTKYSKYISAVGFGSHDFCSETNMAHKAKYLNPIKIQLSLIVKAFGIKVLDGVDVNIREARQLKKECRFAFDIGMDGKFFIHPQQLEFAKEIKYLSNEDILTINGVYSKIKEMNINEIDVIEVDGKIYEKPHINRIVKLINKLQ